MQNRLALQNKRLKQWKSHNIDSKYNAKSDPFKFTKNVTSWPEDPPPQTLSPHSQSLPITMLTAALSTVSYTATLTYESPKLEIIDSQHMSIEHNNLDSLPKQAKQSAQRNVTTLDTGKMAMLAMEQRSNKCQAWASKSMLYELTVPLSSCLRYFTWVCYIHKILSK